MATTTTKRVPFQRSIKNHLTKKYYYCIFCLKPKGKKDPSKKGFFLFFMFANKWNKWKLWKFSQSSPHKWVKFGFLEGMSTRYSFAFKIFHWIFGNFKKPICKEWKWMKRRKANIHKSFFRSNGFPLLLFAVQLIK